MAKKAELSQPGHTWQESAEQWPSDWPDPPDVLCFWWAFKANLRLVGGLDVLNDEETFREFAVLCELVDSNKRVPDWLLFVRASDGVPGSLLDSSLRARMFQLRLPASCDSSVYNPPSPLTAEQILSVNRPPDSPQTSPIPAKELSELESSNRVAIDDVLHSLFYCSGVKPYRQVKRRVLDAVARWLDVQYSWCDALVKYSGVPKQRITLPVDDAQLFIGFQCVGAPVRELVGPFRNGDGRASNESKVRKALKRVSTKLGIPLRRERPGRPPRKAGIRS